jgi:putative DNA primase/helicase
LLEFIGLSLTTSTEFERALMLLGNGSNGKSKALTVISEMVGTDHRAAIALDQLDNRFQLAHLDAKLINVMSETSEGGDLPDAQIKQLISGELITAEHKLRPPFSFRPMAKFWLATNHLPSTRDFSEGVFRRFTVLAFPNKFERGKQDTDLDAKLRAELPGILNLALMALGEAFDRGTLTEPPSSREILANWRRSSDQVLQFFDEELVDDPGISTPSADIYQAYQEWATRAGVMRKLGRNSLTQRLAAMGYEPAKGTGGVRLIWGLRCRLASDWGRQ